MPGLGSACYKRKGRLSMPKRFEVDAECEACKGTGIYVGIAERDGFGVQCHTCKGTGQEHLILEWKDFEGRKDREDVKQVLQVNPGICAGIGKDKQFTLESFGGMPYRDWQEGKPFPKGSEMRAFICPAWWYQSADYKRKPDWEECTGCGSFSGCQHFNKKHLCWARWDRENA